MGPFDDLDPQQSNIQSIISVQVNHGDTIDRITVEYSLGSTRAHGESGGGAQGAPFFIDLDRGERLTGVLGFAGFFDGTFEVVGVQFRSNLKDSEVFGHMTESEFQYQAPPNGEICAFWGRQGLFVDALGVHVRF